MYKKLKYVPILRARQEETKVLKHFDFEDGIYPCIEIIKEVNRKFPERKNTKKKPGTPQKVKTFEESYFPIIRDIKSKYVLVDLPVHLYPKTGMQNETLLFLNSVIAKREVRTKYMQKLIPYAHKVIPIISTYIEVSGEKNTIVLQEEELREDFEILAFRTFPKTFFRDIPQIFEVIQPTDFLIMDWGETVLDKEDDDQLDIIEELKKLKCHIVIHRNPFPLDLTNSGLDHGSRVTSIDNSLSYKFRDYQGLSFSDYAGIKKDNISGAPISSPGFVYYDAVQNSFYGYRYKNGGHKKGETKPQFSEYETTIIPSVLASESTERMENHPFEYLGEENIGWEIMKNIELGAANGGESGQSPAKFKRIGVEHYLHCIREKIRNGDIE